MKKEDTVKLISAEGFEFVIDRRAALVSNTLRNMLTSSGSFTETQLGEVRFPDISTPVLEKVCQYFYWSLQYASCSLSVNIEFLKGSDALMASSLLGEFESGKETEFYIEPEITLELMMAANYLHT